LRRELNGFASHLPPVRESRKPHKERMADDQVFKEEEPTID